MSEPAQWTNRVTTSFPLVGREADLAMKEEQAMSERLRGKRGFTPTIVVVVVVLGIVAFVSLPLGIAGEGKSIVQRVRAAKTPADQQAIAAVFEKEAQAARQKAKEHSQLKDAYAAQPDMQMMVSHCDMLVKQYQEIATELTAMAEMHKKMAGMGGMAR
jgi:Tfp pilus assembly protein PilE